MYEVVLEDRLSTSLKKINPWLSENNLQKVSRKYETQKKGLLQKLLSGEVRV
jgi:type I site-specific restriction-modification system R (restriction) subunit